MEMKALQERERYRYRVLWAAALAAALLPVSCSYIMDSGMAGEWIARVTQLASGLREGQICFYPSEEVFRTTGVMHNAMNSNLWFLLPGLLYRFTGNMVLAYRIFMLLLQTGTALAAGLFFRRFFRRAETGLPACAGTLLYLCGPYRIYACYDAADLSQAVAWLLLPLYAWALLECSEEKGGWKAAAAAALALAGIGYADAVFFVILAGAALLSALLKRKPGILIAAAVGSILFLPGLYRMWQYLFTDAFAAWNLPVRDGLEKGYRLGEYFAAYSYRDGHPGLGLGMLAGLTALLWSRLVAGQRSEGCRPPLLWGLFFLALSFHRFPWAALAGLGGRAGRLTALLCEPGVFFGMAFFCFCVPAARGAEKIGGLENREASNAALILLLLLIVGICVYQCNMLTYNRVPLSLG